MLGTRSGGGSMEGADESTELQWHPLVARVNKPLAFSSHFKISTNKTSSKQKGREREMGLETTSIYIHLQKAFLITVNAIT